MSQFRIAVSWGRY